MTGADRDIETWNRQADLAGGVYIVTGGSSGIGAAIATRLAERGAAGVVISGRDPERCAAVRGRLAERGAEALAVRGDLQDVQTCRDIIEQADRVFGRIDGLVNAAGSTARGGIEDTDTALWDHVFAVNARAPFLLSQGVVRVMRRERIAGSIVNIITMSSHGGQPKLVPYSASKGALAVLTKNMAHGLLKDRIRVNGINIGWTDTPHEHEIQSAEGQPADWLEKAESAAPFGRLVKPDDVARMTLFLLSEDSGLTTGAIIDHDQMVMGAYD